MPTSLTHAFANAKGIACNADAFAIGISSVSNAVAMDAQNSSFDLGVMDPLVAGHVATVWAPDVCGFGISGEYSVSWAGSVTVVLNDTTTFVIPLHYSVCIPYR